MKILIVDDNADARYILKKTLASAGHQVLEAENGKIALSLAQEHLPDLVISDILMPEMDGFQFCRRIRGNDTFRDMPFVFYTATYTDAKDEEFALSLGADQFLRKPMDGKGFLAAIQNLVRKTAQGEIPASTSILNTEKTYLKLYNERLIQKLEKKIIDLEEETEARQQAEANLKATMEAVPDMIFRLDRQARFLDFKPGKGFAPYVSPDAFIGRTADEVLPEEIARQTLANVHKALETGRTITYDYQLPAKGKVRDYEARYAPATNNEVVAIVRDVTELRNLQKQLLQAQKMEAVGHLAGGVAHDFNNMLSIILGYAEMAVNRVNVHDPLYGDLEEIINAANRSTSLVQQLLAFSRQQPVTPQVLDLNHLIGNGQKMLGRLIGEDIEMVFIPGHALWSIKIDPSQIDQIMANLAVNARDAIEGVGQLTIETGNIVIDEAYCQMHHGANPGKFVSLTVSDSGTGMSRETLDHLFDPFYTTKPVGSGTGLGLSTVYGIVKQNNGFVYVYSELDHGTSFKIYFPNVEGPPEKMELPRTKSHTTKGDETILIVEDERMILKLCQTVLQRQGYQVLCASSPEEAIILCKNHDGPINLLITDVVMPKMNGKELKDRIEAMRPNICVLFMSGYTYQIIQARGVLDEELNFIQKPFSTADLVCKVRQILDD